VAVAEEEQAAEEELEDIENPLEQPLVLIRFLP
jgi:hypothetical protein